MRHLTTLSRQRPHQAISLLEKQAFTEMFERNVTQVIVFLNVLVGLKPSEQ